MGPTERPSTPVPGERRTDVAVSPVPLTTLRHRFTRDERLFAFTFALTLLGIIASIWAAVGSNDVTVRWAWVTVGSFSLAAALVGIVGFTSAQEALAALDVAEDPNSPRTTATAELVWRLHARTGKELPFVELYSPDMPVTLISVAEDHQQLFREPRKVQVIGHPEPGSWLIVTFNETSIPGLVPHTRRVAPADAI